MELRDARLGDAEHLADLAEREVLVVVERYYKLLPLREACDRLGEAVLHLARVQLLRWVDRVRILDRVEQ